MTAAALDVQCVGLVQIYSADDGTEVVALRSVDLDLPAGSRTALLGPSGAGKSTLLNLVAGLLKPTAGTLRVGDQDLAALTDRDLRRYRSQHVGTLLQNASRNLLPYATGLGNLAFARLASGRRRRRELVPAQELLDAVGAGSLARRTVGRMSGGEQQRVALAVAMANEPGILLADEPTSQLGAEHREAVLDALSEVNTRFGATLVVVTHDASVANRLGRTVTIRDGRVGAVGHADEDYAVVARDGSIQLPPAARLRWAPGTLLEVDDDGAELRLRPRER
jgi:ABC-type lipoprotein export system ATPase subunit